MRLRSILEKRKELERKLLVGILLSTILVVSSLAFALFQSGTASVKYGKFKFTATEKGWQTKVNGFLLETKFLPSEVENISCFTTKRARNFGVLYIAKSQPHLAFELARNLPIKRVQPVCLEECEEDLPIKTCSATETIVVFEESNETAIVEEGNCIFVKARSEEMLKAADRLVFCLHNIRK